MKTLFPLVVQNLLNVILLYDFKTLKKKKNNSHSKANKIKLNDLLSKNAFINVITK